MKSFIKKIAKPIAIGIFFMALFFNVKLSLENPFIRMDNAALAQTSSSGNCEALPISQCPGGSCSYVIFFGGEPKDCCTACCPTGFRSICNSSGCQCEYLYG